MKKILLILFGIILITGCNNEETKEKTLEEKKYYEDLREKFKNYALDAYKKMTIESDEEYYIIFTIADLETVDKEINEFKRYNSEELCDKYLSHVLITNQIDKEKYKDKKEAVVVNLVCEENDIYFN